MCWPRSLRRKCWRWRPRRRAGPSRPSAAAGPGTDSPARRWRRAVPASGLSFGGRRRFWQLFPGAAIAGPQQPPSATAFDDLLARARAEGAAVDRGSVTLVGAGPGDPELLTLRAVRALQ